MALSTFVGQFAPPVGGAPLDQAITGVGFTPKAIFFWATEQTSEAWGVHYQFSYGMSIGGGTANEGTSAWYSLNALNPSDVYFGHDNYAFSNISTSGGGTWKTQTTVKSLDSDGFTVTYSIKPLFGGQKIYFLALGGADLTNVYMKRFNSPISGPNQSLTGFGFQPDACIFISTGTTAAVNSIASQNFRGGIGFACKPSKVGHTTKNSDDAVSPTNTSRAQALNYCCVQNAADPPTAAAYISSYDSGGITLTWDYMNAGVNCFYYCLALKGGSYAIGSDTQNTSTGNKATTGVGFQPAAIMLSSANTTALSGTSVANHNRVSLGGASSTTKRGAIWGGDTDNVSTSSVKQSNTSAKTIRLSDTDAPTVADAEADIASLDNDGFTLNWTTADATSREFLYLAMGNGQMGRQTLVNQAVKRSAFF